MFVLAVIGACGGVGSAVIRYRTGADTETARIWRENAEAEKTRADRLEATILELTRRVERLEIENAVLRDAVTAAPALEALGIRLDALRVDVLAALAALPRCAVQGLSKGL